MNKSRRAIAGFLLLLLCSMASAQNALEQPVSIRLKNVLLEQALLTLINDSGVRLSFSNAILPAKQVTFKAKQQPLQRVLESLLQNTNITYREVGDQIVLYKMVLLPPSEKRFTISGFVEDAETGERLIAANVFDRKLGKGIATNDYGFFSLTLPAGEVQLSVNYLGYEASEQIFSLQQNQRVRIRLEAAMMLPQVEIIAHDSLTRGLPSGASTTYFNASDIKQLPSLGGEPDLIRSIHLLPGIQTGTDGIGGIHVRGGNSEHNLILIDGVPVYNVMHAGGLFSVFNTDAIRSAQLYKGGFPARYGGRLSSILDIHTKEGNMKKFSGQVEAGLLTLRASLEGPIVKDKASFFVSARRSYLNWYLNDFSRKEKKRQGEIGETGYQFYDINAKLNYTLSEKDKVYVSFYKGNDNFHNDGLQSDSITVYRNYQEDTLRFRYDQWYGERLSWGNAVGALRWNHLFSNKLFANATLTYSRFWTDIYYGTVDSLVYINRDTALRQLDNGFYQSSIKDLGARLDFDYHWSPAHTLRFGVNATQHLFSPGTLTYDESTEYLRGQTVTSNDPITSHEYVAYAESNLTPGTQWSVNIGLHAAWLEVQQKNYYSLQPRFSTYWRALPKLGVKASAGRMTQFVHLLSNSNIGLPTDLWVPATAKVPPQDAWQVSAGLDYNFKWAELSVEGYYKKMDHLLSYTEGAFFLNDWEDNVTNGNGRAYGIEWLLRKSVGKSTGWIAYTLAWADRQFERVNLGRTYPFKYDRRHDLKIVFQHSFSKWLNVSADWVMSSGAAYSLPISEYNFPISNGSTVPVTNFGSKNQFRMPLHHRLDVGANFTFKTKEVWHTLNVGVYNVYNRRNPLYYDIKTKYVTEEEELRQKKSYVQVVLLPFLPSASYSIRF